jgi:hypothetical protein
MTHNNEFKDLHKFALTDEDWAILQDYQKILQVISCFLLIKYANMKLLGSSCIPGDFECRKHTYSMLFHSSIRIIHEYLD